MSFVSRDYGEIYLLRDGGRLRLRRLGPADASLVRSAFELLSPRSRYLRFFNNRSFLRQREIDCLTGADRLVVPIGAFEIDATGSESRFVGGVHLRRLEEGSPEAEFAMTVSDAWQHRGVGTRLAFAMFRTALELNIRTLHCVILTENEAMLRVLERVAPQAVLETGNPLTLARIDMGSWPGNEPGRPKPLESEEGGERSAGGTEGSG